MHRRNFLTTGAAALAFSSFPFAQQFADTRKRVGLIGTGWYGKTDLLRLIQVAPVEVVSLCDVDSTMLADAADAGRHAAGLEEDAAHLHATTARCCKPRGTSTSSSSARPITGTRCR